MWSGIFRKMTNLRFLELYSSSYMESSHVYLPKGLKFLPNTIQYLGWHGYPMKSLPSTFCPRKLVELHMPHSHVKELWNGVQVSIRNIVSFFFLGQRLKLVLYVWAKSHFGPKCFKNFILALCVCNLFQIGPAITIHYLFICHVAPLGATRTA